MRDKFLIYGAPRLEDAEKAEVMQVLDSGWLGTGPRVHQFEAEVAAYKGVSPDQVVAVNSCTAALHLSIVAADLGPGAEVITTPLTFCATVNAIIHAGARPVLADVDPRTQNIDPAAVERAITPRTKAILPVHFAGLPCEMDALMDIARRHNLKVIEDCAHAIETEYHGGKAGVFGDFGCFSFYVTKNVVTGEGGMIIAKDAAQATRLRTLALHGMNRDAWKRFGPDGYKHYQVTEAGFKYNMMDLQAAIGIHQLRRVEENLVRRAEIWKRYNEAFAELPLTLPAPADSRSRHGLHLYTVLVNEPQRSMSRDQFLAAMNQYKIGLGVHYLSVPEHPYYQTQFGWRPEQYPNAMDIGRRTVSLPLSPALTDADVEDVIGAVRAVLDRRQSARYA